MKILITGAGGFLGTHLSKKLLAKGHEVTSFSRSSHPKLNKMGVKQIQGNLKELKELTHAFKGQDAIFHMASLVGMWGKYDDFYQTNVIGTENVIKACEKNSIKKLIYTSTPSVAFGEESLEGVDESTPYPESYLNYYSETKSIAEKKVLSQNSSELLTVALRPHLIFGADDPHMIPQIIKKARAGKLKRVGDGTNLVDVIYVENAADAHINALENLSPGASICGKAYFLGQEHPVNLWDFIDEILKNKGIPPLKKSVSASSALKMGAFFEKIYTVFGIKKDPPMTRFVALQLSKSHYFNHRNAKRELGYEPKICLADAIKETFAAH